MQVRERSLGTQTREDSGICYRERKSITQPQRTDYNLALTERGTNNVQCPLCDLICHPKTILCKDTSRLLNPKQSTCQKVSYTTVYSFFAFRGLFFRVESPHM